MHSLASTSSAALRRLLAGQPVSPAKVAFAWRIAAGVALARAGTATWTSDGTLRIEARDANWQRELRHARSLIATRMSELLGADIVRRIVIVNAAAHEASSRRGRRNGPATTSLFS